MARPCGKCGGTGWVGPRSDLGKALGFSSGGPCRVCGGSGEDKRWGEKPCRGCYNTIEYRYDWSNVSEYCPDCRKYQYKDCANPHCHESVKYKRFWDKIPDYCQTCKGWYEKDCENAYCKGKIRVHASWSNIPKYCSCKGYAEKDCKGGCGGIVRFRCDWNNIPDICESCRKNRNNRSDQLSEERNMQRLIQSFPELRDKAHAKRFHDYLSRHYVRGVDKPTTYEELRDAYFDSLV